MQARNRGKTAMTSARKQGKDKWGLDQSRIVVILKVLSISLYLCSRAT